MFGPGDVCLEDRPAVVAATAAPSARPDGPRSRPAALPDWLREVVLLGGLYLVYELGRTLSRDELSEAVVNGRHLLSVERTWHLDPEHVLNQLVSGHLLLAVPAAYVYSTLHYLVTPLVLLWMYRHHREHYRMARTTLAFGTLLALVGFYLLPTAPPRLLTGAGLQDTLAEVQGWGWWGGDGSVPRGLSGLSNQFAAMPSLHVGWAVWSGVLVATLATHRLTRAIGAAYPVLTTLVVLATGNHYLLDTAAGAAVIGLGALAALSLSAAYDVGSAPGRAQRQELGPRGRVLANASLEGGGRRD
jgi:hypothetical protein